MIVSIRQRSTAPPFPPTCSINLLSLPGGIRPTAKWQREISVKTLGQWTHFFCQIQDQQSATPPCFPPVSHASVGSSGTVTAGFSSTDCLATGRLSQSSCWYSEHILSFSSPPSPLFSSLFLLKLALERKQKAGLIKPQAWNMMC